MTDHPVDLEKLRVALRRLSKERLLGLAERAVELVPRAKLQQLVEGLIDSGEIAKTSSKTGSGAAAVLAEVQEFHDASLRGDYYESFGVNSKNFMESSAGTETFIAEFERLLGKCVRVAAKTPRAPLREAFELLFELLRRIDEGNDDVIFFADEGGAWRVGVEWREALPAYFRCLADAAPPEEFARIVDRTIQEFDGHERSRHLTAARAVASAAQKAALRALPAASGRRP
jgi:hypothetical protein